MSRSRFSWSFDSCATTYQWQRYTKIGRELCRISLLWITEPSVISYKFSYLKYRMKENINKCLRQRTMSDIFYAKSYPDGFLTARYINIVITFPRFYFPILYSRNNNAPRNGNNFSLRQLTTRASSNSQICHSWQCRTKAWERERKRGRQTERGREKKGQSRLE